MDHQMVGARLLTGRCNKAGGGLQATMHQVCNMRAQRCQDIWQAHGKEAVILLKFCLFVGWSRVSPIMVLAAADLWRGPVDCMGMLHRGAIEHGTIPIYTCSIWQSGECIFEMTMLCGGTIRLNICQGEAIMCLEQGICDGLFAPQVLPKCHAHKASCCRRRFDRISRPPFWGTCRDL